MRKNEFIEISITDITAEGNGVGHYEGMAVFVPETAVGDVIEAKVVKVLKNYSYAIINRIITPSPDRISPDCPYFPKCGGCSFRHISYDAELKAKEKFVRDAFTRIGKINCEFEPILGCTYPDGYRNKAQYPVSFSKDGTITCGFYAKRSHRIIGGSKCRLLPDEICTIAEYITDYCNKNHISAYDESTHKGVLRHIYIRKAPRTGEIMVCLITTKLQDFSCLCTELTDKFKSIKSIALNINSDNTNVILGKKTKILWGKPEITDILCGITIKIAPEAFYQVNSPQAEKLYSIAEEFADLHGTENLLDLYCGTGTIGLSMADSVRHLTGIELIPQAIENARKNALHNHIHNADFICADTDSLKSIVTDNGLHSDVILLDPPRKGCTPTTLDTITQITPDKIVMISCNPASAARDCAYLSNLGFQTIRIKPVDMFPRTGHVECVVLMSRIEG